MTPPVRNATFDLAFDFVEHGGGVTGHLEYNTGLFDAGTAERLAAHLTSLLEAARTTRREGRRAAADDHRRAPSGRPGWQGDPLPAADSAFPALFEAQAARTPHTTALTARDTTLDYAALNDRANRLAHHLITLGVGPRTSSRSGCPAPRTCS
ncbi:peptide synthetase [Streptomyces alboflavus]|uniref:Peptide synthetase n=1 Tax=Streptomyces alboflavus TaxID=67267 RepID=A0A1Z1WSQ8_9ACTN|nr:AMP-binding protein [Streptomyces alboflavus]ARX89458.1 peptide synthetase [Streptomyces alboflavus]